MKKAVIFDMDGVISDTQVTHSRVWSEVLGKYGIVITPEEVTRKYAGTNSREAFGELLSNYKLESFLEQALSEKQQRMEEEEKDLKAIPGVIKLIKRLFKDGRDLAVASGSEKNNVESILEKLKVKSCFGTIVGGNEVKNTKPAPDEFLLAAQRLEREPAECIVIEDSRNGMLAAKLAGMYCIGLVADRNMTDEFPADRLVESLTELDLDDF